MASSRPERVSPPGPVDESGIPFLNRRYEGGKTLVGWCDANGVVNKIEPSNVVEKEKEK